MHFNWKDMVFATLVVVSVFVLVHFTLVLVDDTAALNKNTEAIINDTEALINDTKCIEELTATEVKLWQTISELDNCRQDELLRSIGCTPAK